MQRSTLFEQVKTLIIRKIQSGEYAQGSMIPNELELADIFNVSQGTIRRALKELVQDGILIRQQGKGTFVASFTKNLENLRERINWFYPDEEEVVSRQAHLVSFEVLERVSPKISALMQCYDEPIIRIRRELSYGENKKISAFDDIYLKQKDFPTLTKQVFLDNENRNPYILYEQLYGLFIVAMEDKAKAVLLNPEQAKKAGVGLPYPAICLQRRSYTLGGKLVELRFIVNVMDDQHMLLRSANLD